MILLQPSASVKKETKINFTIVEKLLTSILEHNHKRKLNLSIDIHKSRVKGASFCYPVSKRDYKIELDLSKTSKRYVICSLLHEVRHCIQNNVFGYWNNAQCKSYKEYYRSKEEVDARKMEKLTTEFIRSYDAFVKLEDQFKRLQLNKL